MMRFGSGGARTRQACVPRQNDLQTTCHDPKGRGLAKGPRIGGNPPHDVRSVVAKGGVRKPVPGDIDGDELCQNDALPRWGFLEHHVRQPGITDPAETKIEQEVTQRVKRHHLTPSLDATQHVRMGSDEHIASGCFEQTNEFAFPPENQMMILLAPMEHDHDEIDVFLESGDFWWQVPTDPLPSQMCQKTGPLPHPFVVDETRHHEHPDLDAMFFKNVRLPGLLLAASGPGPGQTGPGQILNRVQDALVFLVLTVVVRRPNQREPGMGEHSRDPGFGSKDERRMHPGPVGFCRDGRLQVAGGDIVALQQGPHESKGTIVAERRKTATTKAAKHHVSGCHETDSNRSGRTAASCDRMGRCPRRPSAGRSRPRGQRGP